jgi:MinD-like ATPase involved in chromosome partitioning or flagellar assembly
MGPASGTHPVAAQQERPPAAGDRVESMRDDGRSGPISSGSETGVDDATRVLRRPTSARQASAVAGSGPSGQTSKQRSYGDRSTGILPAVGASGPRPGEQDGVTDTDDVTRNWAAPTAGEPVETPAEPGPGQFSLPLPPSPSTGTTPAVDRDHPSYGPVRPAPPDPAYGETVGGPDPVGFHPRTPSSGEPARGFGSPATGTSGAPGGPAGPGGAGRAGGHRAAGDLGGTVSGQPPTVDQLTAQSLLRERRPTPQTGWRRAVYTLSARTVNPGQSPEDRRREELIARATVPVPGCYRIAVISLKGGVGKTTTTVTLGATLASLRGDRVIAVDANPDRGTLSGKIPLETVATVRNLLNDVNSIQHYFDVRRYTSQSADRLEVLASESDPAVSTAFSEADYRTVAAVLERFYNIVLTDCGTGLLHSAMRGVLDLADQIVLVSSGSVDGARSASATLDWLEAHGRSELVRNSVAVINSVRPKSGGVDLDRLEEHFAARCRAVARIPYDPHLEEGAEVDLGELSGPSRASLLELAAYVADAFPRFPRGPSGPRD